MIEFYEDDLIILSLRYKDIEFWIFLIIEIANKLQKLILEGEISQVMSSHLGQQHRPC
jgi:hypothetical protein